MAIPRADLRCRQAAATLGIALLASVVPAEHAEAQTPVEGEVRQLVTFRFLPARAAEAMAIFREEALPLYRDNRAMLSFRGLREVESPVPLDLVVVSGFRGMEGMDASNEALSRLAEQAGSSIREIYGAIAGLSATHDDQFVRMLPELSTGDPTKKTLVALVWYRLMPGEREHFERAFADELVPWERRSGVPASTGRFLLSDGWHYLRIVGVDSLGDYQAYWEAAEQAGHGYIDGITTRRREVILAPVPELAVR